MIRLIRDYFVELYGTTVRGWNAFWFTPAEPHSLALIRIGTGLMLLYTHLIWSLGLDAFLGNHPWFSFEQITDWQGGSLYWSYWNWINVAWLRWAVHIAGLIIFALLTVGWHTRVTSVLAFLVTVSYAHRFAGATFGLDQVNGLLAMYLMFGRAGDAYSVDAYLARRRGTPSPTLAVSTNVAVRLLQCHMCVMYIFAGISKIPGETWQNGTALWFAFANHEYQSIDMTWVKNHELLVNFLTLGSIAWELTYAAFIWPKLTRPIVLAIAVAVHLGIGVCMGMLTFGLAMVLGNVAFVAPCVVRQIVSGKSASS
jgi:hypothetical protein